MTAPEVTRGELRFVGAGDVYKRGRLAARLVRQPVHAVPGAAERPVPVKVPVLVDAAGQQAIGRIESELPRP